MVDGVMKCLLEGRGVWETECKQSVWERPTCRLSFTACHHLQPNHFPWLPFITHNTLIIKDHSPPPPTDKHTHRDTHIHIISKRDVFWRLTAAFDSTMLSFCQTNQRESVWFLMQCGEAGRVERDGSKFINSSDLPVKSFFSTRSEHKQTQSCANDSKWDVTLLLGLIY